MRNPERLEERKECGKLILFKKEFTTKKHICDLSGEFSL